MKRLSQLLSGAAVLATVALVAVPTFAEPTPEAAAPETVDQLVERVEATYKDVQSLQASFEQVTVSPVGGDPITQAGTVSLKRPRMMRWDSTTSTAGSLFVTDGTKMWLYTPEFKQVLVYQDLSAAGGMGQLDLLSSLDSLDETFTIQADLAAEGDSIPVVLTPKVESQYKTIVLEVAKSDYGLKSLVMTDVLGVETTMRFSGVELNAELPDDRFSFTAPEGVDVIQADGT